MIFANRVQSEGILMTVNYLSVKSEHFPMTRWFSEYSETITCLWMV